MILIILFLSLSVVKSQINKSEFIYRVKTGYYSLQETGIKNFSFWIISDMFKNNTKSIFKDKEIYPLELVWISPDRLFFIKQSMPVVDDSISQDELDELIMDLQKELKGIFADWQRFIGSGMLHNLPEDFLFSTNNDTVRLEFQIKENNDVVNIKMYFGINGLCFKIITDNLNTGQKLYTYPAFDYVEKKWLCKTWHVQIIEQGEVTGGFLVNVMSEKISGFFIPVKIKLHVQSREKQDKLFVRNYDTRNIMINRDLKIIEK